LILAEAGETENPSVEWVLFLVVPETERDKPHKTWLRDFWSFADKEREKAYSLEFVVF
jgi:hypothetical protein